MLWGLWARRLFEVLCKDERLAVELGFDIEFGRGALARVIGRK